MPGTLKSPDHILSYCPKASSRRRVDGGFDQSVCDDFDNYSLFGHMEEKQHPSTISFAAFMTCNDLMAQLAFRSQIDWSDRSPYGNGHLVFHLTILAGDKVLGIS